MNVALQPATDAMQSQYLQSLVRDGGLSRRATYGKAINNAYFGVD